MLVVAIQANFEAVITKTGWKVLVHKWIRCKTNNSMTVDGNTVEAEGIGHLFENMEKASAKAGKKLATIVSKNSLNSFRSRCWNWYCTRI